MRPRVSNTRALPGTLRHGLVLMVAAGLAWSCSSSSEDATVADLPASVAEAGAPPVVEGGAPDSTSAVDSSVPLPAADTLPANRDRLLGAYLAYLAATPGAQSNGLDGSKLKGVCDLWRTLNPSAQSVYLTLTARLQSSKLGSDGTSMLSHATKVYRVAGGDNSTSVDPGKCGGDGNRMFFSIDNALHAALLAANANKGASGANGKPDIGDVGTGANSVWRESRDLGGPHAPFDLSDETENGPPRGQVQYFRDPASAKAKAVLGRTDLMTLVDPYALELDQDYDCPHNSNPICTYTTYGNLCFPGPPKKGTDLYTEKYGSFDPTWQPTDCTAK